MNKVDKKIKKALRLGAPVMTDGSAAAIDARISAIESRVSKRRLAFLMTVKILAAVLVLCAAAFLILPNVNEAAAAVMRQIPFLGEFVDLIKIR